MENENKTTVVLKKTLKSGYNTDSNLGKKLFKIGLWSALIIGGIWLITALGPLWIIAILILVILIVLLNK